MTADEASDPVPDGRGCRGTGKTTEARRLEVEENALRLTEDEWVKALYGLANPPSASDVIEARLEIGLRWPPSVPLPRPASALAKAQAG